MLKIDRGVGSLVIIDKSRLGIISSFNEIPTICLIWLGGTRWEIDDGLVKILLKSGVTCFLTYGEGADELHDHLDDVLISIDRFDVVTMGHENDSIEDVAYFFFNSIYFGVGERRYLVVIDMNSDNCKTFVDEMTKNFTREM
ncbi:hypothetical protein [Cupriavidus basilensis]|uniref:Uncharacterized protein n=1 Tax=Cupriavidus basilensis TaxID=68895 RepID=A0A643FNN1_9BURK|nr:hypothetical protein [Cupriavidus basilensis]QOT79042.1 hypothetical protein F7R26_030180 [Cupriavidus basilensis]